MQTPISFQSIAGSTVEDGVLRGVSVITEGEAKGHGVYIDAKTILSVKECADSHPDGVQVKIDHHTGFGSIVGVLKNFRIEGPKLLADLHLLKTHDDYATIVEIAKSMPGSVGLSISFSGEKEEIDGKTYTRCAELYSVDFVDRPAANPSGLFQSVDSLREGMAEKFDAFVAGLKNLVGASENKELADAQSQVTDLSAKVSTFEAEIKTLKADLAAKQAEIDKLPETIKTEGAKEAQRIMANLGQPAIPSTPTPTPATPAKPELKGLEKTKAAFAAQLKPAATL